MTRRVEKHIARSTNAGIINRSVALKVISGVLLLCLAGTAVTLLGMRIFFGTTLNEPTTIEVQIEAPQQIAVNEPFAVTIQVTSLMTTSQTIHSIDLEDSYLENVQLSGSTPAFQTVQSLPLTRFDSYRFEENLPGFATTAIELIFIGQRVGQFSGLIDICLADGNLCLARPLETTIVDGE